jgi:molybdate transport system regulatory protein
LAHITIRIDFDKSRQIGPGKIRLLELIGEHGSISAASRHMGMSYRRAWGLIENLNAMFTAPLIIAHTGGTGGGSAALTETGREVIRCYRKIEDAAAAARVTELQKLDSFLVSAAVRDQG